MAKDKKDYELLERVDFGGERNEFGDLKPAEEQTQDLWGVHEPTPAGEDNPVVSLTEAHATPLLEAGAIKPAGEEPGPGLAHDNPEELGYEGEELRESQQKSSSDSKSSSKKNS